MFFFFFRNWPFLHTHFWPSLAFLDNFWPVFGYKSQKHTKLNPLGAKRTKEIGKIGSEPLLQIMVPQAGLRPKKFFWVGRVKSSRLHILTEDRQRTPRKSVFFSWLEVEVAERGWKSGLHFHQRVDESSRWSQFFSSFFYFWDMAVWRWNLCSTKFCNGKFGFRWRAIINTGYTRGLTAVSVAYLF